jgi:tetrapyrrole methylase family protein/MazG family protein
MYIIDEDPNDGFTLLDGTILKENTLNIRTHTLITQVYPKIFTCISSLFLL